MDAEDDLHDDAEVRRRASLLEKEKEAALNIARLVSARKLSTSSDKSKDFDNFDEEQNIVSENLQQRNNFAVKNGADFFQRVIISEDIGATSFETQEVCERLLQATHLRNKYFYKRSEPYWGGLDESKLNVLHDKLIEAAKEKSLRRADPPFKPFNISEAESDLYYPSEDATDQFSFAQANGVFTFYAGAEKLSNYPSVSNYYKDLNKLLETVHNAACKTVTFKRLKLLESLFELHMLLNSERELMEQKKVPHRDFYNVRKVDTHIHHSALMNQKHLLRFIKYKMKHFSTEIVLQKDGQKLTLQQVFDRLNLTSYDLSIDTLDMHADNTFHRFDRFNLKYNPIGEASLREIFLKTDNYIKGRYLADITKEVFDDLESNKYVYIEPRLSIYGRKRNEFQLLASWWYKNKLQSPNVRYMIQIPRLYSVYKKNGIVNNFQQLLDNIFMPLCEVTLNPRKTPENQQLHFFLRNVVAFDCVDDESKVTNKEHLVDLQTPPDMWDYDFDPPYSYWIYYIYVNLRNLNEMRRKLQQTEFEFRPHAGEAGDLDNLAATFLCAKSINHGILLRKTPVLQYLYYLCQIGLALSPLSNNKLFLDYHANPFPIFFARGLNVSLSTDDPLMLHITKEPLVEEYSCAAQVWKLSSSDLCEIARNSVIQSGFEFPYKKHFIGNNFLPNDMTAEKQKEQLYVEYRNDIAQTNVPDIRVKYRQERLEQEWIFVKKNSQL